MSVIDSLNETSSHAVNTGEKFLKASQDYYKLKIFKQLSLSISMVFKAVAIGAFALIGLAFMAIALAFFIAAMLNSYVLGFLIIGGSFILLAIISFILRSSIENVVIQKLSKTFFK